MTAQTMIRPIPTFVAHVEYCPFCGEAIAREWVSGNTSPRTSTTDVSVTCGEEKRVCHLHTHSGRLTSTTRPLGELLTLLWFLYFLYCTYMHLLHKYESYDTSHDGGGTDCCPLKERHDRALENDIHEFLDGMEKPTHISPTQDVFDSLLREPRYRKGIFAAPDLRHS